jgi:hypothetical protein
MGCEVSIQVHPMPPPDSRVPEEEEPTIETKPAVATKLERQDSMSSTVTIMLDESDFQYDV